MDNDRTIRRLTALEQSASTARVLNLLSTHRKLPDDPELKASPFFKNRLLDRCLVLKHRLRGNEYEDFSSPRPTATKILLPIDGSDLRVGARTFFVGQKDFDLIAAEVFGDDLRPGSHDRQVLDIIDGLPSLDPFLLREHLRASEIEPARGYFAISDSDVLRMFEFVRFEILALVTMSAGEGNGARAYATRLVDKLLSSAPDSGFEPLKDTLKLSESEYRDGVFSWRGFLYYKWMLGDLELALEKVLIEIESINARGAASDDAKAYLPKAKPRIALGLRQTKARVQQMLNVYNEAYEALTKDGQPVAFRNFLLQAPSMFVSLGEQLGTIQHVVSFWNYRFPAGRPRLISPDDLMDILLDFEDGLSFREDEQRTLAA